MIAEAKLFSTISPITFTSIRLATTSQHLAQPLHRQPQRSFRFEQIHPEVADVFYAFGHVADCETSRRNLSAFYFLPGAGGGEVAPRSFTIRNMAKRIENRSEEHTSELQSLR